MDGQNGKKLHKVVFSGVDEKSYPFSCKNWEDGKKFGPSIFIRHPPIPPTEKKGITRGRGDRRPQLDPWDETTQGCVCTGGRGLLRNKNIHKGSEMDV